MTRGAAFNDRGDSVPTDALRVFGTLKLCALKIVTKHCNNSGAHHGRGEFR